jgi:hypothetical protein
MWPTLPVIQWCVFCRRWFWLEEAPVLFALPASVGSGRLPTVSVSDDVPADGYLSALAQEWSAEREVELRIRLWWQQNAPLRAGREAGDHRARHENMRRLAELLSAADEAVLLAEVHRELGEFSACLSVYESLDARALDTAALRWVDAVAGAAQRGEAAPILLGWDALLMDAEPPPCGNRPADAEAAAGPRAVKTDGRGRGPVDVESSSGPGDTLLPDCIDAGFYPLPVTEDVLAFVDQSTEQSRTPVLSVQLSRIRSEWHGWATFFEDEGEYLVREGRLFTETQWEAYQCFHPQYQAELRWYWSQESWQTMPSDAVRDRYFRIQYQLFYGPLSPPSPQEIRQARDRFAPEWEAMRNGLRAADAEMWEWLEENRFRVYWDLFWARFWGVNNGPLHSPEQFRDAVTMDMEDRRKREQRREVGIPRLRFVELGGAPRWFVYDDELKGRKDAQRLQFVGQLWTDLFDVYPAQLVHLFYDPEAGRTVQFVHDFD